MGNAESSSSSDNNNKNGEEEENSSSNNYLKAGAAVAAGAALAWGASQLLTSNRSQAQEQYASNNTSPYHNSYGHKSIAGTLLEGASSNGSAPISWKLPPRNWHKINCDASIQNNAVGIGYIIRDHRGEMIAAEAITDMSIIDITEAEAEAIRKGLEAALQNRLRNVILETDNESLAKMLNGVGSPGRRMQNIICEMNRVKSQFNQCEVRHVDRRANRCADYLAGLGAIGKPWRFGQGPVPEGLLRLLENDKIGVNIPVAGAVAGVAAFAAGAALVWGASQLLSSNRSQAQEQHANYSNTSPYDNYRGPPISWELPPRNWHKINCDGSSTQTHSGIGYIIRDHRGEMIAAEAIFNKSITNIAKAEAEAISKGLEAALQIGLRDVILETDSESVAKMLNGEASPGSEMKDIIHEIPRIDKPNFNQCQIRHIGREANRCANHLAKLGRNGKPWRFLQGPVPEGLLPMLEEDKIGE